MQSKVIKRRDGSVIIHCSDIIAQAIAVQLIGTDVDHIAQLIGITTVTSTPEPEIEDDGKDIDEVLIDSSDPVVESVLA